MPGTAPQTELNERVLRRRAPTDAERQHVARAIHRRKKAVKRGEAAFLSIMLAGLLAFVGAGIVEGEPFIVSIGILLCGGYTAGVIYYKRQRRSDISNEREVAQSNVFKIRGSYTHEEDVMGRKDYIGKQQIKLPRLWLNYVKQDSVVEADVIEADETAYLVRTRGGLSVNKEVQHEPSNLLSNRPGRATIVVLGFACFFLLGLALLVPYSAGMPVLSFRNVLLIPALVATLLFGVPGGWFLHKHQRTARRIHQMYYEHGIKDAQDPDERLQMRFQRIAIWAAATAIVGGGACIYFLETNPIGSALLFAYAGGALGAARPTKR